MAVLLLAWGSGAPAGAQGQPITFSVIADIPYSSSAESLFLGYVGDHNLYSPSEFFVHVGDIKSGTTQCSESRYSTTADILAQLAVPTFILPGDNEWNDCSNPDAAWQLWESYFTDFEQGYCGTPAVEAQAVRHENFAFVRKGVLFVGLNVVGGTLHDEGEWETRLQQDADWVDRQFTEKAGQVRAAVVFGHAGPSGDHRTFFDAFENSSAAFGKPVLYIMGDDHSWEYDNPFSEPNMARITIERDDPPLEVTVLMDARDPWMLERVPWPSGTPVLNQPPCVEVGFDQTIVHGDGVALAGFVTDDGVPGGLGVTWSASGPGQVQFVDENAAETSASFSAPGSYVLRLTAHDGELSSQDELAVEVQSGGPTLSIGDVSVTEGDSGTTQAVFSVGLVSGTGSPVTVQYATANGSATAGSDYQSTSGTLSFSGSTNQRTVTVLVNGDNETETSETFDVKLSNASGAEIADGVGTGTIVDDDAPTLPTVSSFSPASGPVGSVVVISGDSFTSATSVTFGGVLAAFSVVSDTRIDAIVPSSAGSGSIQVTNPAGTGSSTSPFTVEFELAVATQGSGSVDLQPAGPRYAEGTPVTLTPVPAAGWAFLAWSGELTGSDDPATLTMDGDKNVTASFVETGGEDPVTVTVQLSASTDDAEEELSSGVMDLTSSDLELGVEKSAQRVGMRFPGVTIPQGAWILGASIRFTVDEEATGAASLEIRGELSPDASTYTSGAGDISARPTTSAVVGWNPPDWPSVGASGAAQTTPDLAPLVQEIVNQSGWASGNALAFVVTGSGTRTAESSRVGPAPVLELTYVDVPDTEKPSVPQNLVSPAQTETTLTLSWEASTDNVGVVGYRVYGPNGTTDVAGTSFVETGLAPSTSYGCQVSALDAAGNESDLSALLVVSTTDPDLEKPSVPQDLASPAQTGTTISLSWSASTDNVGVVAYRVYGPHGTADVAGTSHLEVGLEPSTVYAFQVSALDAAGNESDLSNTLQVQTAAASAVTLSVAIASTTDDAEERLSSGSVRLVSSDLELILDKTREQVVGLRFAGVDLPRGATIESAWVQFTADEADSEPTALVIHGQATGDAATFADVDGNVTGRPATSASVAWSPPAWTVGAAGADQRSPELATVVQEIVDRSDWSAGNALALIISGSGRRVAESYDGTAAPELVIRYLP